MSTLVAKNIQVGADGTASNNFTIYQPAAPDGTLRIGNGNTGTTSAQVVLTSAGNVGIGTSSPDFRLDVGGGSIAVEDGRFFQFQNGTGILRAGISATSTDALTLHTGTANAERARLDSAGNLGLGVTPSVWQLGKAFEVGAAGVGLWASSGFVNTMQNVAYNGSAYRYSVNGTAARYEIEGNVFKWFTAPSGTAGNAISFTEAMRIDSSGNLLVGTTTAPAIAGAIHVSNASGHGLQITNSSNGVNRRIYMQSGGDLYFWNGTNEGFLSSAGAWTNASDARLKTNIREIQYGLNTVLASQPRHYERVDVKGTYIGFVAQELQQIIPEVVSGNPEKQLGVDYGSLVAVAFKAIQEQQAIIEQLKARLDAANL